MSEIQVPNILGQYLSGRMARREVEKQDFLSQNGQALMAGDPNVMGQYARFDPEGAMGLMQQQQQAKAQQEAMAMRRSEFEMAREKFAAETAARIKAGEIEATAADAERIKKAVMGGLQAKSPEEWDGYMESLGMNDLVGKFDQRHMIAGSYLGAADAIAQAAPKEKKPEDEYQRYVEEEKAAGREPLSRIDYAQAKRGEGMEVTTPDGTTVKMGGGKPVKLTEGQSKDLVYFERATGASPTIDENEGALSSYVERGKDAIPVVGNSLTSDAYQKGNQAAREWLAAILRKDTGAAITSQEFDLYGPMYLPMPGDGDEVLAQKREARKRAESAIKRGLGTADVIAEEMLAQRAASKGSPPQSQAGQPSEDTLDDDALVRKWLETSE